MSTSPVVCQYVGKYFGDMTPQELADFIKSGDSIVEVIYPYRKIIGSFKRFSKMEIEADDLLDWLLANHPIHGETLFNNRTWYNDQVDQLRQFLDEL